MPVYLPGLAQGGYGGAAYGFSSYGSVDVTPPRVTGANSTSGFRVEVFFSEAMSINPSLLDPGSYTFSEVYGVPVSASSVEVGTTSDSGATSVIVTHSGSTLGGQYLIEVLGPEDIAGNPLSPPTNRASFHSLGDSTTAIVGLPSPDDGRTVLVEFKNSLGGEQPMLTEVEFSPGVDSVDSYGVSTDYPILPTIGEANQDPTNLSKVELDVHPMTSADYDLLLGPSLSMEYDGSLLPDDDPSIAGVEIGTGSSVASAYGLILSKPDPLVSYGWGFGDTTGRMVSGTSFKSSIKFSTSGTTFTPAVTNGFFGVFLVSDGSVQVEIAIGAVLGTEALEVAFGGTDIQVPAQWNDGDSHEISLVRNQKGNFYSVLFDGIPLTTFPVASVVEPAAYPAGSVFLLNGGTYSVSLFKVEEIKLTSSTTLFTSAWNFIHNLTFPFVGSGVLASNKITTKRGPLVRGWGDNTPATKEDVEVRLDGTPVAIAGVNPYIGEVYTAIPIPLAAAGTFTVEIDYIWFMNPSMEMVGLNTLGLTLNTWDRSTGHTAGVPSPVPAEATGVVKTNRFPMGVALGPYTRESPKQIGHKYIGFQKGGYSALLNEPTTLLLNKNPHAIGEGNLSAEALRSTGTFDGQTSPLDSATPWVPEGVDGGSVVGDGTYRVLDSSTGPYGIGTAAIWTRNLDLSLDIKVTDIARFLVESYSADGVFTGVGFGLHDGAHLVVVGAVLVDGVRHVGVLKDATKTHLEEGWQIGPASEAEATSTTTIRIAYSDFPTGVQPGDRFRVSNGLQAGIYTIEECGLSLTDDGTEVEVTFSPALPTDPGVFGAGFISVLFEVPWDESLTSFRVYSDFPVGSATVYLGGRIAGLVADLEEVAPYPAQTALLLPATEKGVAFWGSLSRRAESSSVWDITQYTADPQAIVNTVQGIAASAEMDVLPEEESSDPWYRVGEFGTASVDSTGSRLLLKAASGDESIPVEFTYERTEPYLTPKVLTDFEATFLVESGILGAGNASMRVRDTSREVLLTTLHYVEDALSRRLIPTRPNVSLSGLQSPVDAGWTESSGNTAPEPFVRGQTLELSKSSSQTATWTRGADFGQVVDDEGLILESRLSVQSGTVGTRGIGISIGGHCVVSGNLGRIIHLTLGDKTVELRDQSFAIVQTFAFAWDDGEYHTYRLLCDPVADIVVLVVDDSILGSTPFTGFSTATFTEYLGAQLRLTGDGACEVTVDSVSATPLRVTPRVGQVLNRTLGVYLRKTPTGGETNPDDIDSYRIPRSDSTSALNSSLFSTPVVMDWAVACQIRVYLDPNWGLSVYRPDLPLPPGAPGTALPSETTDPAAAWIAIEYGDLPPYVGEFRGTVAFGCMDSRAISQTRWEDAHYRLKAPPSGFGIAPQNMVLNRAFTLTSGEYTLDTTPEVATVNSRTPFLVYVPDCAVHADRVFVVQVDGVVISPTLYNFDKKTQNLQFDSASPLPSKQHPVTITFAVGKPVTKEYLCNQPIEETVTVLNEGTPPVPKNNRDLPATRSLTPIPGSAPLEEVEFTDGPGSLYAGVEYCETPTDGDSVHITTLCDGPGPGHGLAEIEIDGHFTTDCFAQTIPNGPGGVWRGSPIFRGSATHFNQSTVLTAGGGRPTQGGMTLGGGSVTEPPVMYPNLSGPNAQSSTSRMGVNQDFALRLEDVTPREELFDIQATLSDNVPPTSAGPTTANPDGTPTVNGNGAAAYTLVDYSAINSRLNWQGVLAGGQQLQGNEFTLGGDLALPTPVITTGYIRAAN